MARALVEQRVSAGQNAQALRGQIDAMRAKQAEARRKLASLSARRQVAETGRALRGVVLETACGANGFARFDRMHHQIERAEAEAEAVGELYEADAWSLEADAESRERARRVEDELAAIKERLRK